MLHAKIKSTKYPIKFKDSTLMCLIAIQVSGLFAVNRKTFNLKNNYWVIKRFFY